MSGTLSVDFGVNVPGEVVSVVIGTTDATAYLLRKKITVFAAGSVPTNGRCIAPSSYASGAALTVCNRSANALTLSVGSNDIESYGSIVAVAPGGNATITSFDPPAAPAPRTWWLT
jgi:hypothetical protein